MLLTLIDNEAFASLAVAEIPLIVRLVKTIVSLFMALRPPIVSSAKV